MRSGVRATYSRAVENGSDESVLQLRQVAYLCQVIDTRLI
jgi:hypothetical protein